MNNPISETSLTDAIWNCIEIMKKSSEKNDLMQNPTADLIILKKICIALERVMAHTSSMDLDEVARLADEARYLADSIGTWARKQ